MKEYVNRLINDLEDRIDELEEQKDMFSDINMSLKDFLEMCLKHTTAKL